MWNQSEQNVNEIVVMRTGELSQIFLTTLEVFCDGYERILEGTQTFKRLSMPKDRTLSLMSFFINNMERGAACLHIVLQVKLVP